MIIASLGDGDRLNWCERCTNKDDILVGSTRGQATRFAAANLRATGRTSRGVKALTLKKGDTIADVNILDGKGDESLLIVTMEGQGKRVKTDEFRTTARGGSGVIAIKFKANRIDDRVSSIQVVHEDDEVLLTTSQVRCLVQFFSIFCRDHNQALNHVYNTGRNREAECQRHSHSGQNSHRCSGTEG